MDGPNIPPASTKQNARLVRAFCLVAGREAIPPQRVRTMAILKEVVNKWIDNTLAGNPADQLPFACKSRSPSECPNETPRTD